MQEPSQSTSAKTVPTAETRANLEQWLAEKEALANKTLPTLRYWEAFSAKIAQPASDVAALFAVPAFVAAINDQEPTRSLFITLSESDLTKAIETLFDKNQAAAQEGPTKIFARIDTWIKLCSAARICTKNATQNSATYVWRKDREILQAIYQELEDQTQSPHKADSVHIAMLARAFEERLSQIIDLTEKNPLYTTLETSLVTQDGYKPLSDMKKMCSKQQSVQCFLQKHPLAAAL